ncbi:MAG: DUF2149 domain-containing protein [Syntrophomonadaceae bacterium]|nr:DUF2149 domain-containing protein [Syntrophomonadaceae bacterium]
MEGAVNIVDAMLVFACGLMLSLVIHWNVNLDQVREQVNLQMGQEVTENTEIKDNLIKTQDEGDIYQRMGIVYKDPETGQLFMVTNE